MRFFHEAVGEHMRGAVRGGGKGGGGVKCILKRAHNTALAK